MACGHGGVGSAGQAACGHGGAGRVRRCGGVRAWWSRPGGAVRQRAGTVEPAWQDTAAARGHREADPAGHCGSMRAPRNRPAGAVRRRAGTVSAQRDTAAARGPHEASPAARGHHETRPTGQHRDTRAPRSRPSGTLRQRAGTVVPDLAAGARHRRGFGRRFRPAEGSRRHHAGRHGDQTSPWLHRSVPRRPMAAPFGPAPTAPRRRPSSGDPPATPSRPAPRPPGRPRPPVPLWRPPRTGPSSRPSGSLPG